LIPGTSSVVHLREILAAVWSYIFIVCLFIVCRAAAGNRGCSLPNGNYARSNSFSGFGCETYA